LLATVMISNFLIGALDSSGAAQLASSVVTGFVEQPAIDAAAPSSAAQRVERTALLMSHSF
jgi:hypothetical protein